MTRILFLWPRGLRGIVDTKPTLTMSTRIAGTGTSLTKTCLTNAIRYTNLMVNSFQCNAL